MITNYHFMTNEELLAQCEPKRASSPIIGELCLRLEAAVSTWDTACPICEAGLIAEIDDDKIELKGVSA